MTASTTSWSKGYIPVRLRLPSIITHKNLAISSSSLSSSQQNDDETNTSSNFHNNDKIRQLNETIFYIKEHQETNSATNNKNANATLFVLNVPFVPNIKSELLLKSIFGRYGDITRVTILPNNFKSSIRKQQQKNTTENNNNGLGNIIHDNDNNNDMDDNRLLQSWTSRYCSMPSYFNSNNSTNTITTTEDNDYFGKFAHVVFKSRKDMKRTISALVNIMKENRTNNVDNSNDDNDTWIPPALVIDRIEIQTLTDATTEQQRLKSGMYLNEYDDDDDNDDNDNSKKKKKKKDTSSCNSIITIANRYRNTIPNRIDLLNECNAIMDEYEDKEQQEQHRLQQLKSQTDEDGFTMVTYSANKRYTGTKRQYEQGEDDDNEGDDDDINNDDTNHQLTTTTTNYTSTIRRGNKQQRSRSSNNKKKKGNYMGGANELNDFYSFQLKDTRQKIVQSLRSQFEQDIQNMKKKAQSQK